MSHVFTRSNHKHRITDGCGYVVFLSRSRIAVLP